MTEQQWNPKCISSQSSLRYARQVLNEEMMLDCVLPMHVLTLREVSPVTAISNNYVRRTVLYVIKAMMLQHGFIAYLNT